MNIVSQYPAWMFLLCAALGAIYGFALYRKDKKLSEFSPKLIGLLTVLRTLLVACLSALLLAPLLKYPSRKVEPPRLIFAQDVSSSILMSKDSSYILESLPKELEKLKSSLEDDFEIEHFYFDSEVRKADSAAVYKGDLTVYDQLFEELEQRYVNQNAGALVLISDGIYNQGSNPIYQLQSSRMPIYAVALGDTSIKKDLAISRVLNNEVAFLGNDFPVEIEILAVKAASEKFSVGIWKGQKQVYKEEVKIEKGRESIRLNTLLEAEKIGVQRYDVRISSLEDEANIQNNSQSFYIDVLDGRQKILILADAPHPDVAALKNALDKNKNYEVKSSLAKGFQEDIKNYNLLILHQLPSIQNPIKELLDGMKEEKISSLFILGNSLDAIAYNAFPTALTYDAQKNAYNEVQALAQTAFPLFKLSDKEMRQIESFPPLMMPFGNYSLKGGAYPLFNQKIGSVETKSPLMAFREVDGFKTASFAAEGLWKWKLANYAQFQNHETFNTLWSKVVQFLAVKADKSYFRLDHKKQFLENEGIAFEAQLYNKSYELINEAEVKLKLKDEEGKEYAYVFSKSSDAYFLKIASLPPGNYSYLAETTLGGRQMTEQGEFSVREIKLESAQTVANHNLLYQLAKQSGGDLIYPSELAELGNKLEAREDMVPISYTENKIEEIIKLKWIFFFLISLLALEWFIRKRNGAY